MTTRARNPLLGLFFLSAGATMLALVLPFFFGRTATPLEAYQVQAILITATLGLAASLYGSLLLIGLITVDTGTDPKP